MDYSTHGRISLKTPGREGFAEFSFEPNYSISSIDDVPTEEEKNHEGIQG